MSWPEWSLSHSGAFDEDFESLRDKTEWSCLHGRSILLTGATGFFGLWLIELLDWLRRAKGIEITAQVLTRDRERVLVRHPVYRQRSWIHLVEGDVRFFEPPSGNVDYVIHGATDTSSEASRDALQMLDTIYHGCRHVLEIAQQAGCRRLLLISSGAVYGRGVAPEKVSETCMTAPDLTLPSSAYDEGKRLSEVVATIVSKDASFDVVTARCFAFVGAGLPLSTHFAVGNFIRNALEKRDILLNSTGKSVRSYLYAGDLAVWLITLLLNGRPGASYNVGSDEALDIYSMACLVRDVLCPSLSVTIAKNASINATYYVPAIESARRELKLDVWTSLNLAIERTARGARCFGPFRSAPK